MVGDCLGYDWSGYDLLICHPPCTYLSSAAAQYWSNPERQVRQLEAAEFVRQLWELPVPRIAIENPKGWLTKNWRRPDQRIEPFHFGHGFTKHTCLWLKNLPPLVATAITARTLKFVDGQPEVKGRWKVRSRTFAGIARAMAEQWGALPPLPLS